ncbi:hypothetical protein [Pseudoduganella sp.]|uniref:hypothetical protein n=1 Tax=Pseudoduganella sp. TaxID=1880898 RepID=UPI0035AF8286
MKAKLFGAALLALAVAGCGGKASFTISGTIYGLANEGLVLQNNGGDPLKVASGATTFSFPNSISYGTMYNVTVKENPQHMTCSPAGSTGQGSAGHTTSINVVINCTQNSYTLGGTVEGLTGTGLTVINGSFGNQVTITPLATVFNMGKIPVGQAYGLAILTQPKDQVCTLVDGSGVMGDDDRLNVKIVCK